MEGFLPKGGGYRSLKVYRLTEIIYDLTAVFVDRFIERGSRTRDQMVQAARSGKQNIAEGSKASSTSKETEIKLTNVAVASLEELLVDYGDYLRQHGGEIWVIGNERLERLRAYVRSDGFMSDPMHHLGQMNAEEFCNLCITLINQAQYMLSRLLERQQDDFVKEGGIKERMFRARIDYRDKNKDKDKER